MDIRGSIQSIQQITANNLPSQKINNLDKLQSNNSFNEIFKQKINENETLKFSKHASQRLAQRNIVFTDQQLEKLNTGIENAKQKGIKESLVFMDNVALVVNVANKTVITAIEKSEAEEHIFTNINGAVIL